MPSLLLWTFRNFLRNGSSDLHFEACSKTSDSLVHACRFTAFENVWFEANPCSELILVVFPPSSRAYAWTWISTLVQIQDILVILCNVLGQQLNPNWAATQSTARPNQSTQNLQVESLSLPLQQHQAGQHDGIILPRCLWLRNNGRAEFDCHQCSSIKVDAFRKQKSICN